MKERKIFYFILLILTIIHTSLQKSVLPTINELFLPTIYKKFDASITKQYYHNVQLGKNSGLLFLQLGKNTLQVINENNSHNIILTYNFDFEIQDKFIVSTDGDFILVNLQNKINLLQFDQDNLQLRKIYQDNHESQINIIKLNQQQTKAYIFKNSIQFQILSLSDLSIQYGQLDDPITIQSIVISNDEEWICIGTNEGIKFYQLMQLSKNIVYFRLASENKQVNPNQMLLIQKDSVLIVQNYLKGLSVFKLQLLVEQLKIGQSNIIIEASLLNWWIIENQPPYSSALEVNLNEKQLYVGSRSVGILILDIENILKPIVFQEIQISEELSTIILSKTNSYLYLYTKKSVFVYKKDQANLQMHYPNLYNKQSSILSSITDTPYSWRVQVLSDDQHIIVTCSKQGLYIIKFDEQIISQPLQIVSKIKYPFVTYTDNLMLFRQEKYLLIPVQDPDGFILDLYDITNKTSPQRVQRIPSPSFSYIYSMAKNKEETMFVCQVLSQLIFYKILDDISFQQSFTFDIPIEITSDQSNDLIFLNGFPYIIILFRAKSIASLDISDLNKLEIKEQTESLGAEQIVQGVYLTNYCFVAEGLEGVSIIDLTQLPKIVIISNIRINGYTNFLNLIQKDQYIITNQLSGGQLALIDIQNVNKPQFISQLQFKNEFSAAASLTSDLKYLFVLNSGGIRTIQINSNLFIHYEFSEIVRQSSGIIEQIKISRDETLKVGQKIQISLNPLYPQQDSQVMNAFYVENGILKSIPSWMSFDSYEMLLIANINKESLSMVTSQTNSNLDIVTYTIVFQTKFPIYKDSFIFKDEITGLDIIPLDVSQKIFEKLKEKGVLNHLNQISDSFAADEEFNVSNIEGINLSQEALSKIKRVLQLSLFYSPILLQLQKSLIVDFSNYSEIIKSYSKKANLSIKIDKKDGKFIPKLYPSVVTSTSDRQDQIRLDGDILNLNEILQQKIKVYFYNKQNSKIIIEIQVNDGVNNEYTSSFEYQQISNIFIIKEDIEFQPQYRLQSQVNQQYTNSVININSQSLIEFSYDTYSNVEFNELIIQAYIIEDDVDQPISNLNYDIQFQPQQFKFIIKTSGSDYQRVYCFKVNATDSYSWVIDSFCIKASGISFEQFLNLFIQVVGPLLFFFGIFKYWNVLFNLIFYKKNISTEQQVYKDSYFVQKFIVINDSFLIGSQLFNEFKRHLSLQNIDSRGSVADMFQSPLPTKKCTFLLISEIEKFSNPIVEQQIFSKYQNQQIEKFTQKISKKLTQLKQQDQPCYGIFQRYINFQQQINQKLFIIDLYRANQPIVYQGRKIYAKDLQLELNDPGSVLYNCITGLLVKEIIKMNRPTSLVYQYIQSYCKVYSSKLQKNRWYNILADVKHQLKQKKYNQEQIIPLIKININLLQQMLFNLTKAVKQNFLENDYEFNIQKTSELLDINLNLIINNLINDAIGIINPTNSKLFPNSGECIHLFEHNIKKIQADMKKKYFYQCCFSKLCQQEYFPIFSRKNQQLPSWLRMKIENQLITIYGIPPQVAHYNEIKLKIYDNNDCIIREVLLKLSNNKPPSQLTFTEYDSFDEFQTKYELQKKNVQKYIFSPKILQKDQIASQNELVDTNLDLQNTLTNSPTKLKQKRIFSSETLSDTESMQSSNLFQLNRKIQKSQNPLFLFNYQNE